MRCADCSAEMSTVSSPSPPSIVMVLKFRLVPVKLPIDLHPVDASRRDRIDRDLLNVIEFGDTTLPRCG